MSVRWFTRKDSTADPLDSGDDLFEHAKDLMLAQAPINIQAQQSLKAAEIAQRLCDCAHLAVALEPQPIATVNTMLQDRYRREAELAIRRLDPDTRIEAADLAANETQAWMDGPYGGPGTEPTYAEIARHAIALYEAFLSGVRR